MRKLAALVLSLLLVLFLTGCSAKTYFKNRGRDFLDIFSADVSAGLGIGVHARAAVIHTGLGVNQMCHVGLLENEPGEHNAIGVRRERQISVIAANLEVSRCKNTTDEDLSHACRLIHFPGQEICEPKVKPLDVLDCQLAVNAGIVGARVGFRPGQLVDFLLGWFGIDIAGDDEPEPVSASAPPGSTPGAGTRSSLRPSTSP